MEAELDVFDSFNDLFAELEKQGEQEEETQEKAQTESPVEEEDSAEDEESEVAAEAAPEPEPEPEPEPVSRRANERIQSLVEERRALQEQLTAQQQQFQQALTDQQSRMEKLVESLVSKQSAVDDDEGLTDGEKWERRFKESITGELNPKLSKVDQLEQQLAQLVQAEQRKQQQAELQQRWRRFDSLARKAADEVVLKGLAPDDAKSLHEEMVDFVMRGSAAKQELPDATAHGTRNFKMFSQKLGKMSDSQLKEGAWLDALFG
jgi:hypothetical protein